jgi:hypothetical protein
VRPEFTHHCFTRKTGRRKPIRPFSIQIVLASTICYLAYLQWVRVASRNFSRTAVIQLKGRGCPVSSYSQLSCVGAPLCCARAFGRADCAAPTGFARVFDFSQALRPGLNNVALRAPVSEVPDIGVDCVGNAKPSADGDFMFLRNAGSSLPPCTIPSPAGRNY